VPKEEEEEEEEKQVRLAAPKVVVGEGTGKRYSVL
jgi:hypothetical protein